MQGFSSPYDDVSPDAWYLPYVEIARSELGIVDGPPKTSAFHGDRTVNKAEFLKMLLLAQKEKPEEAYAELRFPLSADVANPDEWHYPYMRYALASSMVYAGPAGLLSPGKSLARGEVAVILHRYLMYKQGRQIQELISGAEMELINTLRAMDGGKYATAGYASARALVAARGALASQPDLPIAKGAVKTSEAFRALVSAYDAGEMGRYDETVRLCKEAWALAEKAEEFSPELAGVTQKIQEIAGNIANDARLLMGQE